MQGIMRSFTSDQATDMSWTFWLSLLLTHLAVTESMGSPENCLTQPVTTIWSSIGQAVVLPCKVSSHCPDTYLHYQWFVFKQNYHFRLNLSSNPSKYSLEGGYLHIKSLDVNDSGIYYCAAVWSAPNIQDVGLGTTLVVKGHVTVKQSLLWLSFALLAMYSLAVVTLIILKKHRCHRSKSRMKTDKNNSTKKIQFRDVLQEMYRKQTADRSRYQTEAASTEFNSSGDDIYQNV
ncbi:uncharacterized protein LOC113140955 [Mastacembelus armatus]|uniref:uncharacterized protein LOC113140955 n=1 Tax=Mastacembelus armatus TaxID=205130 RepID=UPI000E4548A8|nr:uncharacterized protein LOC113140955 [Mastacembelus armatus]